MRKIFKGILLLVLLIIGVNLLSVIGRNIPVLEVPILKDPEISERGDIRIYRISTGTFETLEGFLFAGGSFFRIQKGAHNATLILHPKGNLLIDTGLGRNVGTQFEEMPILLKPLFGYTKNLSASEQLNQKKISVSSILLTHMHWDHASGLKDFDHPTLFTTKEEFEYSQSKEGKPPAYIQSQYEGLKDFRYLSFSDGPYEIFDQSLDFYKDGSVVIVKLAGHSPGSIGIFVNVSEKKRYFFSGDLTWSKSGFLIPSHKFIISSLLVDFDRHLVSKEIGRLATLIKRKPEINVIPAHVEEAFQILDSL